MDSYVRLTGLKSDFRLSKWIFINIWMFRLNSQGGNEVFGYKNTFALRNGSLGWFQGVEEQFSLTHEMPKLPSYRKQLNWG